MSSPPNFNPSLTLSGVPLALKPVVAALIVEPESKSRATAYRRGECLPKVQVGDKLMVPTSKLQELLGTYVTAPAYHNAVKAANALGAIAKPRVLAAAVALLALVGFGHGAYAQGNSSYLQPLKCAAWLSVGASAVNLSSVSGGIPPLSNYVVLVPSVGVIWTDDGSTPTPTGPGLVISGGPYPYHGNIAALKFIARSTAGTVAVCFYH